MKQILTLPLLLAACAVDPSPAQARCEPPIALDLSGPRPQVMMTLGDSTPVKALFDTGATTSIVNVERVGAMGLPNSGPLLPPFDKFHAKDGHQTKVTGLSIDGVAIGDLTLPALPLPLPGFAAIFGPSIFGDRLLTLDLAAGALTVCDKVEASLPDGPAQPYSPPPFVLPTIPVEIDGETIAAHLDTGSGLGLSFPLAWAERLPLAEPLVQTGMAANHARKAPIYVSRLEGTVKVGPLTLDRPSVRFSDAVPGPNVGMALLRRLTLVIDPAGKRSWTLARAQAR